jgi:hypothetical protein
VSAEHKVAQRPVAAAKIRRCRVKVHEHAAGRRPSSAHAEILTETEPRSHHVRAIRALDRSRRQGRQPAERVERSESLDDGEASARIKDVMASDVLRVKLRIAAVRIQWMDRATTRDGVRDPLRRCVEEAVLASVSRMLITLAKRPRRISRKRGRRWSVVNRHNRPLLRQSPMIALRVQRTLPTRTVIQRVIAGCTICLQRQLWEPFPSNSTRIS